MNSKLGKLLLRKETRLQRRSGERTRKKWLADARLTRKKIKRKKDPGGLPTE